MEKTIIAFAAHPDDLEFSCTGILQRMRQQGYRLVYVIVTNGENGFKMPVEPGRRGRIKVRKKEQLEAAAKLGVVETLFLNRRDMRLRYDERLRRRLVKIIRTYKPEIIFSFDPANREFDQINLFHHDHRIVAEAVFDAVFAAKNKYMYRGAPHQVGKIYFFGTYKATHKEDVTERLGFKLELLACHRSQFPDLSVIEDFVKTNVLEKTGEGRYCEVFRVLTVRSLTQKAE